MRSWGRKQCRALVEPVNFARVWGHTRWCIKTCHMTRILGSKKTAACVHSLRHGKGAGRSITPDCGHQPAMKNMPVAWARAVAIGQCGLRDGAFAVQAVSLSKCICSRSVFALVVCFSESFQCLFVEFLQRETDAEFYRLPNSYDSAASTPHS